MKNLNTFDEFINEGSSFDTSRAKHIKFILGSSMPYKDKSFYFNFRKGTLEDEIEEAIKSAEKEHKEISKISRRYGKNPTSKDTVLELSDLNYSGLTWIFKALDNLYGQKGSGMGWYGEIEESINEAVNNFSVKDFPVGAKVSMLNSIGLEEIWSVVRPIPNRGEKIFMAPLNRIAKDRYISMAIEFDLNWLNANVSKIEK
jgi:hypothetical protein